MKFKPIPGHPRYEISKEGIIRNSENKKIKSQYIGSTGYYMVSFSYNNKSKPARVHRLLAITYLPNPKNLPEINHEDGIKTNNFLSNIKWSNHEDNVKHAFRTGLVNNTGEKNGQSKLTEKDVKEIKNRLLSGESQYSISKDFPITRSCIGGIKIGRLWKHA